MPLIEVNDDTISAMKQYFKSEKIKLDKKVGITNVVNSWLQVHLRHLENIATQKAINSRDGEVETIDEDNVTEDDEDDVKGLNFDY